MARTEDGFGLGSISSRHTEGPAPNKGRAFVAFRATLRRGDVKHWWPDKRAFGLFRPRRDIWTSPDKDGSSPGAQLSQRLRKVNVLGSLVRLGQIRTETTPTEGRPVTTLYPVGQGSEGAVLSVLTVQSTHPRGVNADNTVSTALRKCSVCGAGGAALSAELDQMLCADCFGAVASMRKARLSIEGRAFCRSWSYSLAFRPPRFCTVVGRIGCPSASSRPVSRAHFSTSASSQSFAPEISSVLTGSGKRLDRESASWCARCLEISRRWATSDVPTRSSTSTCLPIAFEVTET